MSTSILSAPDEFSVAVKLGDDFKYEVIDGEIQELPPMGAVASYLASELCANIRDWVRPRHLGVVTTEVLFRLRPDDRRQRRPDVAFVSRDRIQNSVLGEGDPASWQVVPNLAVEVVSPTDHVDYLQAKIFEYFESGVQLVWVVMPTFRSVMVYESLKQIHVLKAEEVLTGGSVLPGFDIPVAKIFERPTDFPQ